MIVFGYRNPSSGFVRAAISIALGLVLLIWPAKSIEIVVQIIGSAIVILGAASAIMSLRINNIAAVISGILAAGLGVFMIVSPEFFRLILQFVVGLVLALFGFGQVSILFSAREYVRISVISYILGFACAIAGIVILFNPFGDSVSVLVRFMGAAITLYGVSSLIAAFKMRSAVKAFQKANAPAPDLETDSEGFSSYEDVTDSK